MRYYPICLNLRGRRCVVVGGGRVAERKVKTLLQAGANVTVISPVVTKRLADMAAQKKIDLVLRPYRSSDLKSKRTARKEGGPRAIPLMVFAATNSADIQRTVQIDAVEVGALCNAADDVESSDFIVPASFSQGDLTVAISTSGSSPALARRLRDELQLTLGREYKDYLRVLGQVRKQVRKAVPDAAKRAEILRRLATADGIEWLRKNSGSVSTQNANEWASELINSSAKTK